jgi:hypothetical protein
MSHYVTLMFDVEDLCWPGSDDIPLDLARILTRNQSTPSASYCTHGSSAGLCDRR